MDRLYVLVRSDLAPGLQLAQACHALQAFNDQHPARAKAWAGNIAVLAVSSQQHLAEVVCPLQREGVPVAVFCEPDEGGAATAAAIDGTATKRLSSLLLALRGRPALRTNVK